MKKNEKLVVELWHEAVSPKSAVWVNYLNVPSQFCVPGYLRFLAAVTNSLFVCCESKYGCRQFTPSFDVSYYESKKYDLYPIVDGCATECVCSGNQIELESFVARRKAEDPSFDYILLPAGY